MKLGVSFLVVFLFLLLSSNSLVAQDKPSNHEIVMAAEQYPEGSYGNTCKIFVQTVMSDVGVALGPGYRQCYLDKGYEVLDGVILPGDIIQISNDADPETYVDGYHTAIVSKDNEDGTYDVIDSNWRLDELVRHRSNWNPSEYAANKSNQNYTLTVHFYRLGNKTGFYSDGWHDQSCPLSQPFIDAYNNYRRKGYPLGDPWDNGGGVYVHEWYGIWIQDFYGEDNGFVFPYSALILNNNGQVAHLLKIILTS